MLYKALEYPKRASHLGFTISEKERKELGFEPPLNRLRVEMFLCPFGQQLSLEPAPPVKNQRTILRCKSHEIQKKSTVTILVQNLQFLHKNLSESMTEI